MKKKLYKIALLIGMVILFCSCADTVTFAEAGSIEPVGFWYGLWHGLIIGIAWIVSLFSDSTAIYAIYNNGGWYDFGFIWGASITLGGGIKVSTKRKKRGISI